MVATVRRPIGAELTGMVFVDGELWRARAAHAGDQFEAEDQVRVVRMVGGEVEIEALATGEREGEVSS